jgi:class 3 adenylate cyclase
MANVVGPSVAERARSALERHEWREAYDVLSEADSKVVLGPDELELLAQASLWVGRLSDAIAARERAYAGFVKAGDQQMAAIAAIRIARDNVLKGSHPVATAWLKRVERLLPPTPEGPIHGWLDATRAMQAGMNGDFDTALANASRAYDIALRVGDRELEALALVAKGITLIQQGHVAEGLALVDEAAVPAVAGEIEPLVAGAVCCTTISACTGLGDWQRAGQWIDAQDRWCKREHINGFPGMCRLYRAEAKLVAGAWTDAEAEARSASTELEGFVPAAIGIALYSIGLIRLRRGDLPAAEAALLEAHARGRDPEPALSLLRLAQGRAEEATASIRRAIDEPARRTTWGVSPGSELNKVDLLPAQVEIALSTGDLATARHAADALTALADRIGVLAGRAAASASRGSVLLAEGDPAGAKVALREAIDTWSEVDAPWEVARARVTLADAYVAEGNADRAELELHAARGVFDRLGAAPDIARVDERLAVRVAEGGSPLRSRRDERRVVRTFVFTDIVDSTKLAELLGDAAWQRVIDWHDATIRALVAEHRGEEVKATGDGFFLAFEDVDAAIRCTIAIQRRFEEQGRTQGFAPSVRIGLHSAEAGRVGRDYLGGGVNQAARIGGAAAGGEILVSATALATAHVQFEESARRTVALKGIGSPVEVVSIGWR